MPSPKPRKSFTPLESNPTLFTTLSQNLGLSPHLAFHDVLSISDQELLAFTPRPALALVLVLPTSDAFEGYKAGQDEGREEEGGGSGDGKGSGVKGDEDEEEVVWFKQTIHNACGLYGILHAVMNGEARGFIAPDSFFSRLLGKSNPLDCAHLLENDEELETKYREVALQGDTKAPANPEDEVYFHYVCFVKSHKNGHLYELDGDRKGPVDRGLMGAEEDVLGDRGLSVIREFIQREGERDLNFSLLVLAPA